MATIGPDFGYHANALKSVVITKPTHLEEATKLFSGLGVRITTDGAKYLGAPIGSETYKTTFIENKISEWVTEIKTLSVIAKTKPQATYTAFTHRSISEWQFLTRTISLNDDQLAPLEAAIRSQFIPIITGREAIGNHERELISLPTRLGGLGITNPTTLSAMIKTSKDITEPLVKGILTGNYTYNKEIREKQLQAQKEHKTRKRKETEDAAKLLQQTLGKDLQRSMILVQEKGASHWLNVLPLERHGFSLHKEAFRDGICLRYGWRPEGLPTTCACGHQYNVEHALSCTLGGFPIIRHKLRNIIADLLSEVCPNVSTEPHLQPLSGETLTHTTAIRDDRARLDVKANGFWGDNFHTTYFDVRVFNPHAPSNKAIAPATLYQRQEKEKRRSYEERITKIEQGSFSPLVLSTSGGMGLTATTVYRRIAAMISEKKKQDYGQTMKWLRCRLSYALLRSSIMCIRGTRSRKATINCNPDNSHVDVVMHESRVRND